MYKPFWLKTLNEIKCIIRYGLKPCSFYRLAFELGFKAEIPQFEFTYRLASVWNLWGVFLNFFMLLMIRILDCPYLCNQGWPCIGASFVWYTVTLGHLFSYFNHFVISGWGSGCLGSTYFARPAIIPVWPEFIRTTGKKFRFPGSSLKIPVSCPILKIF